MLFEKPIMFSLGSFFLFAQRFRICLSLNPLFLPRILRCITAIIVIGVIGTIVLIRGRSLPISGS